MDDARVIFLARHGETDWNVEGRWQGQTDVPINATGRAQAHALAERMRCEGIAAVASSDLARARLTAQIVADALGIGDVRADRDLREQGYGRFEGLTRSESAARFPEEWARYVADWRETPPGGEPYEAFAARVRAATHRLSGSLPSPALLVLHGGAMRALLVGRLEGIASPASTGWARHGIPNGCVFRLQLDSGEIASITKLG